MPTAKSQLPYASLIALVFLSFGGSLFHNFAVIDDIPFIVQNTALHALNIENLLHIFTHADPELYLPLTQLSYVFTFAVFGPNPFWFHLGNLLIHSCNAMLVFCVLKRIMQRDDGDNNLLIPWACAALFAVHPLHTEAVVWISARKDLLVTFFCLLTLLAWDSAKYVRSFFLFLCALLSKVSGAIFPVILVLYDTLLLKKTLKESIQKALPLFVLSAIFTGISLYFKSHVVSSISPTDTGLFGLQSMFFTFGNAIVPMRLAVEHPATAAALPLAFVQFAIACAVTVYLWKHRHNRPLLVLGFALFFLSLVPSFFSVEHQGFQSFSADRYAELSMVGMAILVLMMIRRLHLERFVYMKYIGTAIIIIFTALSMRMTTVWESGESLFAHAVSVHPESVFARVSLARIQRDSGDIGTAFETLREGLQYGDHPLLHIHAGILYARTGKTKEAFEEIEKAILMDPEYPEGYFTLGSLREKTGDKKGALLMYSKALSLDPSYTVAREGVQRLQSQ